MQLKALLTVALAVALLSTVFTGGALAQNGDDAVAIQTNDQSNENAQIGIFEAQNSADQEQTQEIDFGDGDNGPPTPPPSDPGMT
ncbi:hypothetical protein [Haladaptatus halobius]|uniref:hypothetical protein n=1 Tax=Haladaptatus halobius TaxID=2884875 RepID=UPI001D0A5647|nr:hypothetical protein [Haladaptatus halobius]